MSKLEVDTIEPQSGTSLTLGASGDTITIPSGATLTNSGTATGFGKVLQVVSTTKTDTFTTSSTSYVDVTGLSVSITPSSASNKILVIVSVGINGRDGVVAAFAKLVRDSTDIFIGDSAGSRTRASAFVAENATTIINSNFTHLDLPNTTSSITYKIQLSANNANAVHINKGNSDTDASSIGRIASSITVMEIAG